MSIDYPERKEHRLKGFDYSSSASYFITIVTQNRRMLFGHIEDGTMYLNDAGKMIRNTYMDLAEQVENGMEHQVTVMPNHIHFILFNTGNETTDIRIFVQQFKRLTTNRYIHEVKLSGWPEFEKRLWQRDYYDHIIRGQKSYTNITEYIRSNPQRWAEDSYFD